MALLLALVVVLAASGCEVRATAEVSVRADGSGEVRVVVDLDGEAAAKMPELEEVLLVDDLREAGWRVSGPTSTEGGGARLTATKEFAGPDELAALADELTGPDGPLGSLRLTRSARFARTDLDLQGALDLRGGLNVLSDLEVAGALGGLPFGRTPEQLAELAGGPPEEHVTLVLDVSMPGTSAVVEGRWGERTPVEVSSTSRRPLAWILAALAVACFALAVVVVVQVARHRRFRRPPSFLHEPGGRGAARRTPRPTQRR